jgi:ATP-dependent exoDNAse (exonuclease V) beta subunit
VGQAVLWSQQLLRQEIADADREEVRIAYVALTRAERYCSVALPDDSTDDLLRAFFDAGFVRPDE